MELGFPLAGNFRSMKSTGIIGGGIAGLALAIDLSKRGLNVTVFEKNTYPNHKVCGEYVSAESIPYLTYLGIFEDLKDLPHLKNLEVSSPSGRKFIAKMKVGGIGVSRYMFDDLLYKKAVSLGAKFIFGEAKEASKTQITDQEGNIHSFDKVVAAYGKRSNLDVKWERGFTQKTKNRLNQWVGIKHHIKYEGIDNETIALHNFDHGYCGISRVEDDRTCLCYLVSSEVMKGKSIAELEELVLKQNPHLKHIFENAEMLYDKPLAISQISFDEKELDKNGIPFIGDAAGLITPLCGNGMSLALRSAKMMAESLSDSNKYYQTAWKKQIAQQLWWGRAIQKGFGNKTVTEILVKLCMLIPPLGSFLVSKSHGEEF